MRKKSGLTIVEQAIVLVPEFENVVRKLGQQVTLRGQSKSTLQNYIRRIALFVARFGKLPEQIDPEEINEYLAALAHDPRSPSRSSFKHMPACHRQGLRAALLFPSVGDEQGCIERSRDVVQHRHIAGFPLSRDRRCRPLRDYLLEVVFYFMVNKSTRYLIISCINNFGKGLLIGN